MKILIVEDDRQDAEYISEALHEAFRASRQIIGTESDFIECFEKIASAPPNLFIIDMSLRWAQPKPEMSLPPESARDPRRAGLRCETLLGQDPRTRDIPVVFYSYLSRDDVLSVALRPHVVYLQKDSDLSSLLGLIRSLLIMPRRQPRYRVFVVHGHDDGAKETVARFIERRGLEAIILHELASEGQTIIEKIEAHADVLFAIVLLTPDDLGAAKEELPALAPRARQNVIFELGFFVAKLGRRKVCALHKGGVEIPSDYDGVLYIPIDAAGAWKDKLDQEMLAAGLPLRRRRRRS